MTGRATDPATSHLAATYISGKRPGLKDAFLMALQTLGPSTANEIAQWCVQAGVSANAESVRKRAKELIDEQRAKYGPARTCRVTGQQAGTLDLNHADETNRDGSENAYTDGRTGTSNSGQPVRVEQQASSGTIRSQCSDGTQHSQEVSVQTPEAKRIHDAAEFVRGERGEWRDIWKIAQELSIAARTLGTWAPGTTGEYIIAIESAAVQGLIERDCGRVRRKRVESTKHAVQKSLFE